MMMLSGAVLIATVVLGFGNPTYASASRYHGIAPSTVKGCATNLRIGSTVRLKTPIDVDYGWVEWRASRTSHCAGYQWSRMYLTRDIGYVRGESRKRMLGFYQNRFKGSAVYGIWKPNKTPSGARYLKKGAYNTEIFYAPNAKGCDYFNAYVSAANAGSPYNVLGIAGWGATSKPEFCA
ncbi:hypothetical protein [Actinoplanes sp. NPDC020271]|uniref:hypothetical protein n=1 Tax=Actinoplanes sp. NPDC020271 TaxID=3363896 RepID=UPI0037B12D8A